MSVVTLLEQEESVRLDPDRLTEIYVQLGENGAEDVICRAVEDLAVKLGEIAVLGPTAHPKVLQLAVQNIADAAFQVGLSSVSQVAMDVDYCVGVADQPGVAATLERLKRIGDRSLTAVWDLRDLSI